jgi:hypothetical protein
MFTKFEVYEINGWAVNKDVFDSVNQLQSKIEKQEKIIELLKESNDRYADCIDVGVYARKTKKKVKEIEE